MKQREQDEILDLIPCLNESCDKNGTIRNQYGEAEQCQWCFEVRFVVSDKFLQLRKEKESLGEALELLMPHVKQSLGNND